MHRWGHASRAACDSSLRVATSVGVLYCGSLSGDALLRASTPILVGFRAMRGLVVAKRTILGMHSEAVIEMLMLRGDHPKGCCVASSK